MQSLSDRRELGPFLKVNDAWGLVLSFFPTQFNVESNIINIMLSPFYCTSIASQFLDHMIFWLHLIINTRLKQNRCLIAAIHLFVITTLSL